MKQKKKQGKKEDKSKNWQCRDKKIVDIWLLSKRWYFEESSPKKPITRHLEGNKENISNQNKKGG